MPVKGHNKTRQRETVCLPSRSSGRRLPIIWIFHGVYQKKVKVPDGFPCLVVFTESGMVNSEALIFILERAILPNLDPGLNVIWLDLHPAHFSPAVLKWAAEQPELTLARLNKPLTE